MARTLHLGAVTVTSSSLSVNSSLQSSTSSESESKASHSTRPPLPHPSGSFRSLGGKTLIRLLRLAVAMSMCKRSALPDHGPLPFNKDVSSSNMCEEARLHVPGNCFTEHVSLHLAWIHVKFWRLIAQQGREFIVTPLHPKLSSPGCVIQIHGQHGHMYRQAKRLTCTPMRDLPSSNLKHWR